MQVEIRRLVVLYVWVSTPTQAKEGYSLDAQISILTQYCQIKGYPPMLSDYYREFILIRKRECARFLREQRNT